MDEYVVSDQQRFVPTTTHLRLGVTPFRHYMLDTRSLSLRVGPKPGHI
jgi:hypothetical protein